MRAILLLAAGCCSIYLHAQSQDTVYLSLKEVLSMATTNYPRLKAIGYELEAAKSNIKLQQQTIIPQLDASYQANLATHNNIGGMIYPQYVLPISGPTSPSNDYNPVTGSAAAVLLQWQPGIFGERKSSINAAIAASLTKQSNNEQELFNHKVSVCNQYIDVLYFQQLLQLYEENTKISQEQLRQVKVLAVTGLKPGVDTALIQSELSRTRIEWLTIKNEYAAFLSSLQESLATDSIVVGKDTLFYSGIPAETVSDTAEHPFVKLAKMRVEENKIQRIAIGKLAAPRLSLWGTTYGRGSGLHYDGTVKTMDGFSINRINYGAGVQLSVPLLNHAEVKTKLQRQDWLMKAEEEQLNQVSLELKQARKLAATSFSNALNIAKETPLQVHAAEYAFKSMQIRYNNGLVNYTELLQTQAGLLKARMDEKKSQASLWKALLYKAAVYGDLNVFINQVK